MPRNKARTRLVGGVFGVVLVAVATYSVFQVDWSMEAPVVAPPIRPLKTIIITSPYKASGRKYPGRVRANREVDLAFHVSGPLIEFLVKRGDEVAEAQLLARIDPRDFQSNLAAARGVLEKATSDYKKVKRLFEEGNAGQQEVVDAKATFEVAEAEEQIAAKALEDADLRASFAGVIADTFVENFENVRAKQRVLSLQDVSSVQIEVNVPEERFALGLKDRDKFRFEATFEYLPDRPFDVTIKEFATVADASTQTFAMRMVMPAPNDVSILPGMTATITPFWKEDAPSDSTAYAVPLGAVPVDGVGNYFVWKVEPNEEGTMTVRRVDVTVGQMLEREILVTDGIERGDRIAAAGVHLLKDGQKVRLLDGAARDGGS